MIANSKKFLVAVLALGLLMPTASFAQTEDSSTTTNQEITETLRKRQLLSPTNADQRKIDATRTAVDKQQVLCQKIGTEIARIGKEVTEKRQQLVDKNKERKTEIQDKTKEVKEKLATRRGESEDRVSEKMKSLEDSATDTQKAAITAFKTAMEAARTARKAAVDAAQEAFRKSIEDAQNARKTAAETAAAEYKTTVSAALEKAKTDCVANVDPATVRQTLTTALRTAKAGLQEDRKALDSKSSVQEAVKTRNTAVKAAHEAFATILKAELEKLKGAFATAESTEETESNETNQ